MTRYRLPVFASAAAALLSAAGCSYVKTPVVAFSDDGEFLQQDVGDGLVASPNPLIPDVPMPVGFKAVASKSNWRYDGRVRVVNHVYQGHAKSGDAVEFYQRTLPDHNWTLVDMQSVGGATVLRYVKGPEQLAITTDQTWAVTTITIGIEAK
ncbi:MAG: hypothetical protein ACE37H_16590 [Phycisphaeraceae bacterium]